MSGKDEGARPRDAITFRIDGLAAQLAADGAQAIWTTPDAIIELDLTVVNHHVYLPVIGKGTR